MLQKTGWRIKQLVSSKGNRNSEKTGEDSQDSRGTDKESAHKSSQGKSWTSRNPSQELALILRRTTSSITIPRPLPPADLSAHSSASSLCSCDCGVHVDCEADVAGNLHSLSKAGPGQPNPDILYLPPLKTSTSLGSDAKTSRLIFSGSPPSSPAYSSQRYIFESQRAAANIAPTGETFDLLQALTIQPAEDELTPTPSVKGIADSKMEGVTDNVEQLIRETDAAFQAVGSALADAKAATQGWYDVGGTTNPPRTTTLTRKGSKRQYHRPPSPLKNHSTKATTFSKAKRKKSTRKKISILNRTTQTPVTSSTSRHTLNDMTSNMAEVFNKRFRTEVDEMLTPDRIQQLRSESKPDAEGKVSSDSNRSSTSDGTQNEPFHLEAVASRLDAARAMLTPSPEPILLLPTQPVPDKSKLRQLSRTPDKENEKEPEVEKCGMMFNDLSFPSPPKHPSICRKPSSLETIPEASLLRLVPDCISLPSTNYTLTAPLFRHGPIRLTQTPRKRKGSSPDEENLDWTAFQMAIAGGVDKDIDNKLEHDWEGEERILDEICDWWNGFGYESLGHLVSEEDEKRWNKKNKKKKIDNDWYEAERHETMYEVEASYELPMSKERRCWSLAKAKRLPELKLRSWPVQEAMSAGGSDSLPPSPMLDLVVPSPSRRDEDLVPMGYNLGHDLGDFLRWECQHRQSVFVDD